jgi:hypothetical protein
MSAPVRAHVHRTFSFAGIGDNSSFLVPIQLDDYKIAQNECENTSAVNFSFPFIWKIPRTKTNFEVVEVVGKNCSKENATDTYSTDVGKKKFLSFRTQWF